MTEASKDILTFNRKHESIRISFFIYAKTESLLGKASSCGNNPTQLLNLKVNKHALCG